LAKRGISSMQRNNGMGTETIVTKGWALTHVKGCQRDRRGMAQTTKTPKEKNIREGQAFQGRTKSKTYGKTRGYGMEHNPRRPGRKCKE